MALSPTSSTSSSTSSSTPSAADAAAAAAAERAAKLAAERAAKAAAERAAKATAEKAKAARATSSFKGADKLGQAGLNLIKEFEGLRLTAYRDPVGVLTIGYGHTGSDVKPGMTISQQRAEQLLKNDTGWAQKAVRDTVKVPLTQGQFDALTSFTFNLGAGALRSSTLVKKLNAGDYAGAQNEFGRWVHAGGQVLAGLVRRRAAEAKMFGSKAPSGTSTPTQPTQPSTPSTGKKDYRVRAGDTMSGIAAKHKMSLAALAKLNPQVKNLNQISVGQLIHVAAAKKKAAAPAPKAREYTVRSGDTFSGIAAKNDMSLAALKKLNPQVRDINRIFPGQKLKLSAAKPAAPAAPSAPSAPSSPPKPPTTTRPPTSSSTKPPLNGMPSTAGMSTAKKYELYSKYVNTFGDAQARKDLAAGKRVIVGLRRDTPFGAGSDYDGKFDDKIIVMWKENGQPRVAEFDGNTEPNKRWADDPSQATKPVGRLVDGKTYHYKRSYKSAFGGNILAPDLAYGNPTVRRDTNRDYKIDGRDQVFSGDWGGQGYYFHRGVGGNTYSAGCQTLEQSNFNAFWRALGTQSGFSYVLANVTKK
ncbi:MAG: glycoside hydrolase family protein [Archangium sp.]